MLKLRGWRARSERGRGTACVGNGTFSIAPVSLGSNSSRGSRLSSTCGEDNVARAADQWAIRPSPFQAVALGIRGLFQACGLGERLVDGPVARMSTLQQVGIGIDRKR